MRRREVSSAFDVNGSLCTAEKLIRARRGVAGVAVVLPLTPLPSKKVKSVILRQERNS